MSEEKSRFKIKKGDIEIEYEGKSSEVNSRYKEAFEWIKSVTTSPSKPEPKKEKKIEKKKEKMEEKRGGSRTAVISPAVDNLIEDGFLDDFKTTREVIDELKRKTVPVGGADRVRNALNRRVPKILDRVKNEEDKWVYRKKS